MSDPTVSLQSIAQKVGVSPMTVSRVMRNLPGASEATRQIILETAKALDYQPDPELARAMKLVRTKKKKSSQAILAVIREFLPDDELQRGCCHFVPLEYIQRSAESYGYVTEEFWLGRDGLTPQRLSDILHARGIEGIIVSPQSVSMPCKELDYSRFASVALGYTMKQPSLHRSTTNLVPGLQAVMAQLQSRGYKRIGVAISQWLDDRTQNVYSSGMLHFQYSQSKGQSAPLLLFPHNDFKRDEEVFYAWMKEHQPDVLITFEKHIPTWLKKMGLSIPEDIGLVVHDWTPSMKGWAGIDHRREYLAHGAVDLVAMQLMRNERGIPPVPRQISIPPAWVEGPSIRPVL